MKCHPRMAIKKIYTIGNIRKRVFYIYKTSNGFWLVPLRITTASPWHDPFGIVFTVDLLLFFLNKESNEDTFGHQIAQSDKIASEFNGYGWCEYFFFSFFPTVHQFDPPKLTDPVSHRKALAS